MLGTTWIIGLVLLMGYAFSPATGVPVKLDEQSVMLYLVLLFTAGISYFSDLRGGEEDDE